VAEPGFGGGTMGAGARNELSGTTYLFWSIHHRQAEALCRQTRGYRTPLGQTTWLGEGFGKSHHRDWPLRPRRRPLPNPQPAPTIARRRGRERGRHRLGNEPTAPGRSRHWTRAAASSRRGAARIRHGWWHRFDAYRPHSSPQVLVPVKRRRAKKARTRAAGQQIIMKKTGEKGGAVELLGFIPQILPVRGRSPHFEHFRADGRAMASRPALNIHAKPTVRPGQSMRRAISFVWNRAPSVSSCRIRWRSQRSFGKGPRSPAFHRSCRDLSSTQASGVLGGFHSGLA